MIYEREARPIDTNNSAVSKMGNEEESRKGILMSGDVWKKVLIK